jgi:nucleoid DNA-binding protein
MAKNPTSELAQDFYFLGKLCYVLPRPGDPLSLHHEQPPHIYHLFRERDMATKKSSKKPTTKSEILSHISEKTGLKRKDIVGVFDELGNLIKRDLKQVGLFNVVGLMKVKAVHKPAQPARKGINPFTKEEVMFKAKPARTVVKVLPLKTLKDMV